MLEDLEEQVKYLRDQEQPPFVVDSVEKAAIKYLRDKEQSRSIYLDELGMYEGIPIEEVKQAILGMFEKVSQGLGSIQIQDIEQYIPETDENLPISLMKTFIFRIRSFGDTTLQDYLDNDLAKNPTYSLGGTDDYLRFSEEEVVAMFKDKVNKLSDFYEKERGESDMSIAFRVTANYLLQSLNKLPPSNEKRSLVIQQMASSLGANSLTPLKQLLFFTITQMPQNLRGDLSQAKLKEIEQRMACRYALTRGLRYKPEILEMSEEERTEMPEALKVENQNLLDYPVLSQSNYVEWLLDDIFQGGAYDFEAPLDTSRSIKSSVHEHALRRFNILDETGNIDQFKFYNFIKSDLPSFSQRTYPKLLALDRAQEAIYKEIQKYPSVFSVEYLRGNDALYLTDPDKIALDFDKEFNEHFAKNKTASLLLPDTYRIQKFTEKYIKSRLKEVREFAEKQSKEAQKNTSFEADMTTAGASLELGVSIAQSGSLQGLSHLSSNSRSKTKETSLSGVRLG